MNFSRTTRIVSIFIARSRWISTSVFILCCYLLLGALALLPHKSFLRSGLAIALALFGTGFSLVAILFPQRTELDLVERLALAAGLSLAVGGMTGLFLARSPWKLSLNSILLINILLNLACAIVSWRQQSSLPANEERGWHTYMHSLSRWWQAQNLFERLVTAGLVFLLVAGAWAFRNVSAHVSPDPPMTEFFLLGQHGLAEDYPEAVIPMEPLNVGYGITNREKETVHYQVQVFINGEEANKLRSIKLDSGETQLIRPLLFTPEQVSGPVKIDFILYRYGQSYRALYFWVEVKAADAK